MLPASNVVRHYLTTLAKGDLDDVRGLLADDFTFRGPRMDSALDKEAFLSDFGGKFDHVQDLRVLRQVVDGEEVVTLYELDAQTPAASVTFLMTEWNTVQDSQVASALLVFDTAVGAPLHAAA
jgi:ketosteroid isomerase-like protein